MLNISLKRIFWTILKWYKKLHSNHGFGKENLENKKTEHKSEKRIFSIVKRIQSFEHAGNGIRVFLKTTHNAWVHISVAVIVIFLGFVLY